MAKLSEVDIIQPNGSAAHYELKDEAATQAIEHINEEVRDIKDDYAKKDGDYETLGAGSATNLKGNTVSNAKFSFRTAGGSADIATGQAQLNRVRGNTVVWNQIVARTQEQSVVTKDTSVTTENKYVVNTTTTVSVRCLYIYSALTIPVGHKALLRIRYKTNFTEKVYFRYPRTSGAYADVTLPVSSENWVSYSHIIDTGLIGGTNTGLLPLSNHYYEGEYISTPLYGAFQVFDLTQMFGVGNEPTVEEFEKMFPEAYYPYSEPALLSFRADGIKTVGFNQFNYATGKAKVIPNNAYQITGTYTSLSMNGETITPDSDGIFTPTQFGDVDVVGGNATTCIHLVWSGIRNGEFEEYWESRLDYPLTQLTGKLNGEGESVVIFPDGLRSAGTVHDEIVGNKAIKRIGSVDLGTLMWGQRTSSGGTVFFVTAGFEGIKRRGTANAVCVKYTSMYNVLTENMTIAANTTSLTANTIRVRDDSQESAPTSSNNWLSGVILYYELTTPQEYILDDFQLPAGYRVDDFGTEEIYVSEGLTTPCDLDVVYGINAADTIRRLPDNYVSATQGQTFTDTEKEQARTNIEAGKASDVDAANVNVGSIEEQLLDAENSADFDEIPFMGGQPMMLFGEGTPQDSIIPRNWKQFLDGGYDWNGTPSIEGQVYIDITAETNGRYTAVKRGNTLVWLNF